jgi:pimeloyl-ACP methyl ester carboxylesterase
MHPTLVLIPGLLNDADLWQDQVSALSDVATCIVADITRGESLGALAQSVLTVAGSRFALAGFSLGGYVAQEVVRLAPERVAGLALLDTSINADTPVQVERRQASIRAAHVPGAFHGFGRRLIDTYLDAGNRESPQMVARIRAMTERLGPSVFIRQNAIERKDGADVLRGLTCPLLIVCGENDAVTPLQNHRAMLVHAPQGNLAVIPGSGHMTPIENPLAVTAALRRWLGLIA